MDYILVFVVGVLVGVLSNALFRKGPDGVGILRIVRTEEGPYLFLELNDEVESLYGRKYVSVKVDDGQNAHE